MSESIFSKNSKEAVFTGFYISARRTSWMFYNATQCLVGSMNLAGDESHD